MLFEEGRSGVTSGLGAGVNLETREDSGDVHRRIATVDEPDEQVRVHRELE